MREGKGTAETRGKGDWEEGGAMMAAGEEGYEERVSFLHLAPDLSPSPLPRLSLGHSLHPRSSRLKLTDQTLPHAP